MENFKNKTIIVTGASSGIGEQTVRALSSQGANIVLIARTYPVIKKLADELEGNNIAIQCDLSNVNSIKDIITKLESENLCIDGVVYSAGIAPLFLISDGTNERIQETININALSFVELIKELIKYNKSEEKLEVVAISSITSLLTNNRQFAYSASKGLLNTSIRYLAKEYINTLKVNAILPGIVDTAMLQKLKKESKNMESNISKTCALGVIPPENIADIALFLLSDKAKYITGQLINVDAGYLLC